MLENKLIKIFARKLKDLRKNKNVLQRELAAESGLSLRHFQKIEAGQSEVKLKTIAFFAEVLKVPSCYMLNEAECLPGCPAKLGCMVELLDLLPMGIQLIDMSGKILYANQTHREFLNKAIGSQHAAVYIWDGYDNSLESKKIRVFLESLVQTERELSTLYTKIRSNKGGYLPLKIEWKFVSGIDEKNKYFLATTSYHPSW